ncbi:MAG: thiosulfate oxidation carrier protein SoxY [Alphaproteobacteria bacterium]
MKQLNRRGVLAGGVATAFVTLLPNRVLATLPDMQAAIIETFGDGTLQQGRISLHMPPIAENGYSVPLAIEVDSPMTEADHVRRIAVFSPENPLANIVRFDLGPRAGRANVATRIRLARTQEITVVAEMNDGARYAAVAEIIVTIGACVLE